jgi:hypothetical protein
LARGMAPKDIPVTQDETLTGGLCLVAMAPVSNSILLEHIAEARDQDPWSELLASVAHHLGAHHSPAIFHGHHELSKAVAAPRAAKQRVAA